VSFVNARVLTPDGTAASIRFDQEILDVDGSPAAGDEVVDLAGAHVLPGLINGHDHLELNHYGQLKGRPAYQNASAWIEDLRPALKSDLSIARNQAYPLAARLFIGGLKNLLAGVTTVAHHNPVYRECRRQVPIRLVEPFGWAHSFALERQPVGANGELGGDVRARCRETPSDIPFVVHAAEGVDEAAAAELDRLEASGCLRANTVLVHGVALTPGRWAAIAASGTSLIWCPASNRFLFDRTAPVRACLDLAPAHAHQIALGTDSRITGTRDLLEEIRLAASFEVSAAEALRMVTTSPARIFRLRHGGAIQRGAPADLAVLPPAAATAADSLLRTSRSDISLVVIDGVPLVGSPALASVFSARGLAAVPIAIDGRVRLIASRLARAISACPIREPGVGT
jgi:cytosine/adenosine deaminase-related metal-dependent hydrolase